MYLYFLTRSSLSPPASQPISWWNTNEDASNMKLFLGGFVFNSLLFWSQIGITIKGGFNPLLSSLPFVNCIFVFNHPVWKMHFLFYWWLLNFLFYSFLRKSVNNLTPLNRPVKFLPLLFCFSSEEMCGVERGCAENLVCCARLNLFKGVKHLFSR